MTARDFIAEPIRHWRRISGDSAKNFRWIDFEQAFDQRRVTEDDGDFESPGLRSIAYEFNSGELIDNHHFKRRCHLEMHSATRIESIGMLNDFEAECMKWQATLT